MAEEHPFCKYKKLFSEAIANKGAAQEEMCNGIIESNDDIDKIYSKIRFDKVCPVALYYLADISEKSYYDKKEGCKYLYYGIYNNILNKENNDYDKFEFYKILLDGYYNINDWDSYNSYIHMVNGDILEKYADLMEMYDNLDNFKENINQETNERCKYINKCIEIYKKYAENYKTNNDSFCAKLNEFIERYNKDMEKDFPCNDLQRFLPYIGKSNLKLTPLRSWIHILLRRKKGIRNNIDQRNYQLYNLSKHNNSTFTNGSYNIAYNSVKFS